jgi:hypothetical protein
MDSNKKERIRELVVRAREFRLCGPCADPEEQAVLTAEYRYLVVQFKNLVGPILPENLSSRLQSIEVEFDYINTAYSAQSEIDSLLPEIESALDASDEVKRPQLSALFVNRAADVLAETSRGLSGAEIVRALSAYALDFNVAIPHSTTPFEAPNKRTALSQNLMAFSESQQYQIIHDLCDHSTSKLQNAEATRKLKLTLMTRYGFLATQSLGAEVNEDLVNQTRHWLDTFPEVLAVFNQGLQKYESRVFVRNLLDDLRLALELLVQTLVGSAKTLENQLPAVGAFVKVRGGSPELVNMFGRLIDYYCKYQNTYIKHDDAVIEEEVEFIIEITAAFMKHFVRLEAREVI